MAFGLGDLILGGAALGVVNGITSSIFGGASDSASQQRQYDYQLALNQQQQQWQENMWNKVNEYNTPTNQMQRLRDAGLNANLAYGSLSGNVAGNVPQTNAGQAGLINSSPNYANTMLQALEVPQRVRQSMAQSRLLERNADLVDMQTQNEYYKALNEAIGYDYNKRTFEARAKLQELAIDDVTARIDNQRAQQAYTETQTSLAPKFYELQEKYNNAQIQQIFNDISVSLQELALKGKLTAAQCGQLAASASDLYASRDYKTAQKEWQKFYNRVMAQKDANGVSNFIRKWNQDIHTSQALENNYDVNSHRTRNSVSLGVLGNVYGGFLWR